MSYTPVNWQTGETIIAEKLNKMDNGWNIGNEQLFSETVTTTASNGMNQATFNYNEPLEYNTITVIFNNIEYTCSRKYMNGINYYGGFSESGPDFSEYPFVISSVNNQGSFLNDIFTSNEGTFNVSVMAGVMDISDSFRQAVGAAVNRDFKTPFLCVSGTTIVSEMMDAVNAGRLLYFYSNNICHFITTFRSSPSNNSVQAVPAGDENTETYGFNSRMVFTIYNHS